MRLIQRVTIGSFLLSLISCSEPEPVATGSKTKPSSASSSTTVSSTASGTGNAALGQTALTTSCNSCHGSSAHAFVKADAGKLDAAASKSYHKAVSGVFTSSGADMKAYLETI